LREDNVSDDREGGGGLSKERVEECAMASGRGGRLAQQGEGRHAEAGQVDRLAVRRESVCGGEGNEAKGGEDCPQKRQEVETDVQHVDRSTELTPREGVLRVG
jgi:hypothetical protein